MTTRRRAALVVVAAMLAGVIGLIASDDPHPTPEPSSVATITTEPPSSPELHALALSMTRLLPPTSTTAPPPPPTTTTRPPARVAVASGDRFDALAQCESGGDPRAVSSSGTYRGAFQFSLSTWHSIGRTGDPIDYSYGEQKAAAIDLQARDGWGQWPACSSRLGYR